MRVLVFLVVALVVTTTVGCSGEKPAQSTAKQEAVKKFDRETEPHLVVWEDGHDTGNAVIEPKNGLKLAIDIEMEQPKRDGAKYLFPGKLWGGPGQGRGSESAHLTISSKGGYLYTDGGNGLVTVYKEDRFRNTKNVRKMK